MEELFKKYPWCEEDPWIVCRFKWASNTYYLAFKYHEKSWKFTWIVDNGLDQYIDTFSVDEDDLKRDYKFKPQRLSKLRWERD